MERMITVKGLLIKDFYMIRSQCIVVIIVEFCLIIFSGIFNVPYMALMGILMLSNLPINLLSLDEKSRFERFSQTMPYSIKAHVTSKYLISVMLTVPIIVIYTLLTLLCCPSYSSMNTSPEIILQTACYILALGFLIPAVGMPLIFKFGIEKGRTFYLFFVGLITASFTSSIIIFADEETASVIPSGKYTYLILIISLILLSFSYAISLAIYKKKEF